MTEKVGRGSLSGNVLRGMAAGKLDRESSGQKEPLIPMSLFAAWEADRTPPNCVPRLCSLTLSRLTLLKPLGPDISSITLAVKLQNSKRTLRSNEIALPPAISTGGPGQQQLLDTELDLSFALQYPHYLKQWDSGNRLQVMLQRRKRYKNRTIMGFKTICSGSINMAAAMQRTMDLDLELYSEGSSKDGKEGKESGSNAPSGTGGGSGGGAGEKVSGGGGGGGGGGGILMAKVTVQSLTSQPVDHEEATERLKALSGLGDGAGVGGGVGRVGGSGGGGFIRYVEDDEDDLSSNDDNSDSDRGVGGVGGGGVGGAVVPGSGGGVARPGRVGAVMTSSAKSRGKIPPNARQRNLKQKFIALLKRFKITEDLVEHELAGEGGCIDPSKLTGADLEMDAGDIEDLIDELEDLSDSGPEMDTLSVTSTPKPSLRPFFASSRSLLAPDPCASSSVFTFPSVYTDTVIRPGQGILERHYSDESSKRGGGGGAGDSGESESLWGTDQERESDTPTAGTTTTGITSSQQQQQASPFTFGSSSPPRTGSMSSSSAQQSAPQQPTPVLQPQPEDKTKEVRKNRLFNRERSALSVTSTSTTSSGTPTDGKSAIHLAAGQGQQQPGTAPGSGTASSAAASAAERSGKKSHGSLKDSKLNEASPRKILLEQLSRCMPADDALPDHVIMVSGSDLQGCNLAGRLAERQQRALNTIGAADVRATISCLASKIQKFCNCSAKPPPPIKVVLMGNDAYVNSVLRSYVEQFSSKPPDWKNHLKFYVVPLSTGSSLLSGGGSVSSNGIAGGGGSGNTLARYLASLDRYYSVNFVSDSWRETLDRPTDKMLLPGINGSGVVVGSLGASGGGDGVSTPSKIDVQEVIHRIGRYLTSNGCTVQVPIAEAMITYREPGSEEESTQVFIPFLCEVRIGISEVAVQSPAAAAASAGLVLGSLAEPSDLLDGQQLGGIQIGGGSSHQPVSAASSFTSGSPPQPSPLLLSVNPLNGPPGSAGQSSGDRGEKEARDRVNKITPPSSPNISSMHSTKELMGGSSSGESVELQVDYWLSGASAIAAAAAARESAASSATGGATTIGGLAATMAQAVTKSRGGGGSSGAGASEGKSSAGQEPSSVKYTVKAGFRWIVVQRLPSSGSISSTSSSSSSSAAASSGDSSSLFTMTFGLKEKKQKIMRLGKKKSEKEKESEASKSQVVEGINRLVCQAKTHHSLLKVVIDGVEWNNVKFFQLSSQWQTHIRHFPVALFTDSG